VQNTHSEIIQVGGDNPYAGQSTLSNQGTLRPGFYLVLSRQRTRVNQRGGRVVRLFGPFSSRAAAQFLSASAMALGLVAAAAEPQSETQASLPPRHRESVLPLSLVAPRAVSIYLTAPANVRAANVRPYHPGPESPLAMGRAA
jgi:hypothetical protein